MVYELSKTDLSIVLELLPLVQQLGLLPLVPQLEQFYITCGVLDPSVSSSLRHDGTKLTSSSDISYHGLPSTVTSSS